MGAKGMLLFMEDIPSRVEHWFGCRATEPGFAGDIGAIEVWLIDWLIDWSQRGEFLNVSWKKQLRGVKEQMVGCYSEEKRHKIKKPFRQRWSWP